MQVTNEVRVLEAALRSGDEAAALAALHSLPPAVKGLHSYAPSIQLTDSVALCDTEGVDQSCPRPLLHIAIDKGHAAVIRALVARGADLDRLCTVGRPDAENPTQRTETSAAGVAMHTQYGGRLAMLKLVRELGANLSLVLRQTQAGDAFGSYGDCNALQAAVMSNNRELLAYLLAEVGMVEGGMGTAVGSVESGRWRWDRVDSFVPIMMQGEAALGLVGELVEYGFDTVTFKDCDRTSMLALLILVNACQSGSMNLLRYLLKDCSMRLSGMLGATLGPVADQTCAGKLADERRGVPARARTSEEARTDALTHRSLTMEELAVNSTAASVRTCFQFLQAQKCDVCAEHTFVNTCGRCRIVRYCSKECQTRDWRRGHKSACRG